MKKILELNGHGYSKALDGLGEIVRDVNEFMKYPNDFSLVLFTGGADVSPQYYGESSPKRLCGTHQARDMEEYEVWKIAMENNIRTIGICRGIQFITAMSGGTIYHDVSGHAGHPHLMTTSLGEEIMINSYHHQMVIPTSSDIIIGWASHKQSALYYGDFDLLVPSPDKEVEAVIFPSTKSAGVQYHPEMLRSDHEAYQWFFKLADMMINCENFDDVVKAYTAKTKPKVMSIKN